MENLATFERKFELEAARRIVGELAGLIRPACDRLEVGGSIRRGTPYVKDAELVAIPLNGSANNLLQFLDDLVARGEVEKAVYIDKNGHQSNRWGQKYRGILFQGIKVEIFLATAINWGFQKWLRTGPGAANTYIMSYLIYKRAPIHFVDGDGWFSPDNLWHKPKDKWIAEDKIQLDIPDEDTLFALLGMPYLPPNERSESRYKQLLGWNRGHRWPEYAPFVVRTAETLPLLQDWHWVNREEGAAEGDPPGQAERKYWDNLKPTASMLRNRARRAFERSIQLSGLWYGTGFMTNSGDQMPRRGLKYDACRLCLPVCGETQRRWQGVA